MINLSIKRLNYRHVLPDLVLIVISLYASLIIRVGFERLPEYLGIVTRFALVFVVIRVATLIALGVYDIIWRYVSLNDFIRLIRAIALSSLLIMAASLIFSIGPLPRSVFIIDTLLIMMLMGGIRVGRRMMFESGPHKMIRASGRTTLIYGAGTHGRALAHQLKTGAGGAFNLIGFVDDDLQKVGRTVSGLKVLGTRADLEQLLRSLWVEQLVIAIPNLPGPSLRAVLEAAQKFKVHVQLYKGAPLGSATAPATETVRAIELSDLLNRPANSLDVTSIQALIEGKRVLVTGAGGSIGSELARQILRCKPSRLLLLDHSEFNLYQIDHELRGIPEDASLVAPILVDIKDASSLRAIMKEYTPEIVFHAAAYKHVHLVETNPFPSILNNILGTRNLLELSEEIGVGTFVLISTDKAVNPAGIMGATKRVCEMLVAEAGQRTGNRYCAVRFGNVLGSSGSLIPLLRRQISEGQPLTITHPDMTRYFMLIPEAVSLVLKAATIANPGDIAILRMGEPVKILDVARSLCLLMGKSEEQVQIVFTGLRPGEKMFEELYLCGNELKTEHPDILVLPRGDSTGASDDSLSSQVDGIIDAAHRGSKEAIFELKRLVNSTHMAPEGTSTAVRAQDPLAPIAAAALNKP